MWTHQLTHPHPPNPHTQYELVFDPESGEYFYFNAKTGESQWTKPKVLKDHEMYADDASANEAAKKIQVCERPGLGWGPPPPPSPSPPPP